MHALGFLRSASTPWWAAGCIAAKRLAAVASVQPNSVQTSSKAATAATGAGAVADCEGTSTSPGASEEGGEASVAVSSGTFTTNITTSGSCSSSSSPVLRTARYPPVALYASTRAPVFNFAGQVCGQVVLPGDVFSVPVRRDILHRVVRWQRAKAQQGTHKAKDRSEVRGGGRKPWVQKGMGRARQGSIRAPQWKGGGVVHGPVPRSHAHRLNKKVRRLGLKCALSAKLAAGRLTVVDSLAVAAPAKTRDMARACATLLPASSAADEVAARRRRNGILLMDSAPDGADGGLLLRRASANLVGVDVLPQRGANVLSILGSKELIMTEAAVQLLCARLRAPINRLGLCGRQPPCRSLSPRAAL